MQVCFAERLLKLIRAWRGSHRVVHVSQNGRVYNLDTDQKVLFDCLQPHIKMDLPSLQLPHSTLVKLWSLWIRSPQAIDDDLSQPSYRPEQILPEISNGSLPSRKRQLDGTKFRAGVSRLHYQQFDYSTSGTDDELSEVMLLIPTHPHPADEPDVPDEQNFEPEAQDLVSDTSFMEFRPRLFSDQEPAASSSPQLFASDHCWLKHLLLY